jgi:mono/diheme cytochrome c family protein
MKIFSKTILWSDSRRALVRRTAVATVIILAGLSGAGGLLFMYTGLYYIAASEPHIPPVRWLLETGRTRSVKFHSRGTRPPEFNNPEMIQEGFRLYRGNCEVCHGGPGVARRQTGLGIRPTPPPLVSTTQDWTAAQIYWILTHGLKMSGMPAFAVRLDERQRWSIVAFLYRLLTLTAADYSRWAQAMQDESGLQAGDWLADEDYGFEQLARAGDPELGRIHLREYGCTSCHVIPHIGTGRVGPPLTRFAERHYIAGSLVNTPRQLVSWITAPESFRPDGAMPNLGVSTEQALHMAAYLYQFGATDRLAALRHQQRADHPR